MDDATAEGRTGVRRRAAVHGRRPRACAGGRGGAARRRGRRIPTTSSPCRPTRPAGWSRTSPLRATSTRSPSWSAPRRRTGTRSPPCWPLPPRCPPTTRRRGALVRAVALATPLRLRSALDEVGADPGPRRGARRGGRRARRARGRAAVPLVGRAGDDDGRAARRARRDRRRATLTRPSSAARRRATRKSYARLDVAGTRAARRRGGRPAVRGHPRPPVAARTAAWSPARRWSCRSARPSSSTSSSSTTRRRSRSPAARARGSPSPTWRPSRR